MTTSDPGIVQSLRRLGLVGERTDPVMIPLAGGVSSDIWRVDLTDGPVCVKRARPRLAVDAVWEVPVERNRYEWAWLEVAAGVCARYVPPLVAHDPDGGCFVMRFLDPSRYPTWKSLLRRGHVGLDTARAVGQRLAAIHAATADRPDLRARFSTDTIFHAIRLEPYLLATAERRPEVAPALRALAAEVAANKRVLVHGDVSPKNIVVGPDGPRFLDAECAWYGDAVFDLAFCLNHLLLKGLWIPAAADRLLAAYDTLAAAYGGGVTWTRWAELEPRAARLLPGLLLARVDGKSPVEYLTPSSRSLARETACRLLRDPVDTLAAVRATWGAVLPRADGGPAA